MAIPPFDLSVQLAELGEELDQAVLAVLRSGQYIGGKLIAEFEAAFAEFCGVPHAIGCNSGTDALVLALRGLGVGPGDEVITTAHSWISTSETITQAGGRVVFCDTDADTFTIDPKQIVAKITPRTVGIIPVHLYGQPADMDPILEIAQKRGLWIIEDCAQAHMAQYKGRTVGTLGTAASFSFYPGKNLGAMGDAGCIVTNDTKLAGWCELYARHGGKGEHTMEGINSRLDGLQAAILSAKLPRLAAWTVARQNIAKKYDELLRDVAQVSTPMIANERTHVFHLYVIRCEERDALQAHLNVAGISTMLNYSRALPFYPAYSHLGHKAEDFPNAFANQSRILSIPIYPEMTDSMVQRAAFEIQNFQKCRS